MSGKYLLLLSLSLSIVSCNSDIKNLETAMKSITADEIKGRISVLASDEFMGRFPATIGEEKTINYLAEQFKQIGLKPGNGESYFQEINLVKITANSPTKMNISGNINGSKKELNLEFANDFVGGSPQISDNIKIDKSDIVFVGYGINAPEYNWNDYNGLDVKGKTVLMLVNDPGYATGDTSLFTGKAMTIYGRWTWKFEEAARQGAKAAIIIHETVAAAYPWGVVQNSWLGSQFYLVGNALSKSDLLLQSWVTTDAAKKIFEVAGLDYNQVTESACKRGFTPVNLNLKASVSFKNKVEYVKSNNVVAVLPGTDKSDEYVIYTAHWDHLGVGAPVNGDSIRNGALDNATGTVALLEIGEAFTKLPVKQKRSVVFIAVTCEEQGLLGSEYYTENPLFPLDKTVGVINMDGLNIMGKTKDMTLVGHKSSALDIYAIEALKRHGRYAAPDPTPEKGGYFRSDHFSFVKAGVPALSLSKGVDDVEHGKEWGLEQTEKWIMANYHKPSDNFEPDVWKFDGMIDDINIYFEIGYKLSSLK